MKTSTAPTAPVLVDEATAAALLSLSVPMLRKDRLGERRIPCVRIGRAVRYSPARLSEFAESGAA